MNAPGETAIGRFRPAGSPRFVRAILGVWMVGALSMIAFGAIGGPYFFDDPASWRRSPEARVEAVASMRLLHFGIGGSMFVLSAVMMFAVGRVRGAVARLKPAGDAARDPLAWMCFVAQLNGGRWIGPAAGRPFAIQTFGRGSPSTLQLSTPIECFTRVSWSRRPAIGRAIDRVAGLATEDGARHGFPGLEVSMSDARWATRLFATGHVRAVLSSLTGDDEVVMVILRPKRLLFHLPYGSRHPSDHARMRRWVDALAELARTIEASGPPVERLEPNTLERMADRMLT